MSMPPISGQVPKAMYHKEDTRYNLCELPPQSDYLDHNARIRIEQQACSIACLVERTLLIETTHHGSTQYHIGPRVPTLARKLKAGYEESLKAYCAEQKRPYLEDEAQASYKGPFQNELSLGDGTAFLVGKQLILTAAHCICHVLRHVLRKVSYLNRTP